MDPNVKAAIHALEQALGTKVTIQESGGKERSNSTSFRPKKCIVCTTGSSGSKYKHSGVNRAFHLLKSGPPVHRTNPEVAA